MGRAMMMVIYKLFMLVNAGSFMVNAGEFRSEWLLLVNAVIKWLSFRVNDG